jgi:hypothetical protein
MPKKNKKPRVESIPSSAKNPRFEHLPKDQKNHSRLDFRTDRMDKGGLWGWNMFNGAHLPEFLERLLHVQKLTLHDLRENGSHLVEIGNLIPEAQKRLVEIQMDDFDELFSWRITGKKRAWSIKEGTILWLLWWDPEHQICPSLKKHT